MCGERIFSLTDELTTWYAGRLPHEEVFFLLFVVERPPHPMVHHVESFAAQGLLHAPGEVILGPHGCGGESSLTDGGQEILGSKVQDQISQRDQSSRLHLEEIEECLMSPEEK